MNPDFRDLLCAFSDAEVRSLIVGAYAVATHAVPRATGDLDLWIEPTPENARRVMTALRAFGAPLHGLTEVDLTTPGLVFQIGVAPRRIDLLTSITGVDFASAWASRVPTRYADVPCFVIGREALIENKRRLGRPKDLADLDLLERHGPDR